MFGHPKARVTQAFGEPGEVGGIEQRSTRVAALRDWRKIQDREGEQRHPRACGPDAGLFNVRSSAAMSALGRKYTKLTVAPARRPMPRERTAPCTDRQGAVESRLSRNGPLIHR